MTLGRRSPTILRTAGTFEIAITSSHARFTGWVCSILFLALLPYAVEAESRHETDSFLGVVIAPRVVDVASELAAKVASVSVAVGDTVESDQLMMRLSVTGLDQDILESKALVSGARARARKAETQLANATRLLASRESADDDVFTSEYLEETRLQRELAELDLQAAKASVAEHEARLTSLQETRNSLEVRAPFRGVVAARHIDEGGYVQSGQPLCRVLDAGPSRIRFAVPAAEAHWLAPGLSMYIQSKEQAILPVVVDLVSPEVDIATEMVIAEAVFTSPERRGHRGSGILPPGSVVRVLRRLPTGFEEPRP